MQNADLFMELAGIAGVFVGFGALIAVRSGGPTQPREVAPMRGVVTSGVLVIVGALLPVTLGFFDLVAHQIWALSTALWLAVGLASYAVILRTPEYRAMAAGEVEAARTPSRRRWLVVLQDVLGGVLFMLAVLLIAIVILLGVAPDLEAGLYFALMVIELLGAAWMLLALVFAQRLPESAWGGPEAGDRGHFATNDSGYPRETRLALGHPARVARWLDPMERPGCPMG